MRQIRKRGCMVMAAVLCAAAVPCCTGRAEAACDLLTLRAAEALALMNSREYQQEKSRLSLARIDYTEAAKSAALKKKNQLSFRWSPLLNFKFPEKPDLAEASEWMYKPLQAQTRITAVRHKMEDIRYAVEEEISNLYVDAYVMQETIAFTQERMEEIQETAKKSEWKLYTGEVSVQETEKLQTQLKKLSVDQAGYLRSFESLKNKISDQVGMDISTGWKLQAPFEEGVPDRAVLEELKQYTLSKDHTYYEKKLDVSLGLLNLEINEKLMKEKYGKQMYLIQPYINQAKAGEELDGDAFKENYDRFLQEIDKKWSGAFRILFLSIPKEWLKGELDGVRYLEDDPYVLYSLALQYADLRLEEQSTAKEIEDAVDDQFEALVSAGNSREALQEEVKEMEKELGENAALHQSGKVTREELSSLQEAYSQAALDALNACGEYTKLWNSFDRLTCKGAGIWMEQGDFDPGGDVSEIRDLSMPQEDGFWYYIESRMEDQVFVLRVSVPDDSEIKVTDYELWVGGIQVGKRTRAGQTLRHLTLALSDAGQASIRLYHGEDYVDECIIDPLASKGRLFPAGAKEGEERKKNQKLGVCSVRHDPVMQTAEFAVTSVEDSEIAYYSLTDNRGTKLYREAPIPIGESLTCLSVAVQDLGELKVEFYDRDKKMCRTGRINGRTMEIQEEG